MGDPDLGDAAAGFTNEGWSGRWNAGSFFFTDKARSMFEAIYDGMLEMKSNEQDSLTHLWANGLTGYKMLNNTYNMGIYHIPQVYEKVEKPLIVAHFHPHKPRHLELFRNLIPERMTQVFKNYGIS
jgi:hypothetical protein